MSQTLELRLPSIYECLVTIGAIVYDTLLNFPILLIGLAFIGGYLAILLIAIHLGFGLPVKIILKALYKIYPAFLDRRPGLAKAYCMGRYDQNLRDGERGLGGDPEQQAYAALHNNVGSRKDG